jgi:CRISPR-associated protein Cmr1
MKTSELEVQFHTPAFLGDAQQTGRWRTPPFKAQLRQWWRIAYAAENNFSVNVDLMRMKEGQIFGHVGLKNNELSYTHHLSDAQKSQVRLRLSQWGVGKETVWQKDTNVTHPNVSRPIGAQLYMGFGPLLSLSRNGTSLKAAAAIQAQEKAIFSIAYPNEHARLIEQALQLMSLYGTVGGRSRNGWGSYSLDLQTPNASNALRPWKDCLTLDWPHAIGLHDDGHPLIWQTNSHNDWASLMKTLAQIKISLRTQFVLTHGNVQQPEDRHWLSYPLNHHNVSSWDSWNRNARLPNTLRFKVRPTEDGQVVGVIFHVPHKPPAGFSSVASNLERIWQKVHDYLDQKQDLKRMAA